MIYQAIQDLETGMQYASQSEAARALGISKVTICLGLKKNADRIKGHKLRIKTYDNYVDWAVDNPNGKRELPENITSYLCTIKSRCKTEDEWPEDDMDLKTLAWHCGGAKLPVQKRVLIDPHSILGKAKAKDGILVAYMGPEERHPWKIQTRDKNVVYVADGGLTYPDGRKVRAEDFES